MLAITCQAMFPEGPALPEPTGELAACAGSDYHRRVGRSTAVQEDTEAPRGNDLIFRLKRQEPSNIYLLGF